MDYLFDFDYISSKEEYLWLFVNHLNEFRYVWHYKAPVKVKSYEVIEHHKDIYPRYHGSEKFIHYYTGDINKPIYYYDYEMNDINPETVTSSNYFEPVIIGTLVPIEIIDSRFLDMTFESEPVKLT